jgi:aspartate/tyrosine/aromatic aminotransferase
MADRIIKMRALLKENLENLGSKHNWDHITNQVCFSFYTFTRGNSANFFIDWYVRIHRFDC